MMFCLADDVSPPERVIGRLTKVFLSNWNSPPVSTLMPEVAAATARTQGHPLVRGGLIGIALGLGIAGLASSLVQIPFAPSMAMIGMAVGFSALIGMVFGFFPALREARLDPIDALRHE